MGPVSLRVRYRPLRIGWCIAGQNLDDFQTAASLSHVFWGGRFNPIIPCDDRELAKALIAAFNVDALYNVSGAAAADTFIRDFPYIRWPESIEFFVDYPRGKEPTVLDVAHPARHLFETHVDRRDKPGIDTAFYINGRTPTPCGHLFPRNLRSISHTERNRA